MTRRPTRSTLFPYTTLFRSNEKTVTQFCRKLAAERPLKDIRDEYNYPKKKGIKRAFSSQDRKSGSAGMPRPISYAVFCLKKKTDSGTEGTASVSKTATATVTTHLCR